MSALDLFTYRGRQVRTVLIDGDPWFVTIDVCDYFGVTNRNRVMQLLDDDEKGGTQIDTPGGVQTLSIISEAGLYSLLFALRPTKARGVSDAYVTDKLEKIAAFRRWVTHDVLPAIRRTGQYGNQVPGSFAEALELAAAKQREIEAAQAELAIAAPKVEAFDDFMESDGTYTMEAAAKSLADVTGGIGRNKLFRWLREHKVLMSGNTPYQRYAHWFKVVVSTYSDSNGVDHTAKTTYVRPAGLDGIRQMWKRVVS